MQVGASTTVVGDKLYVFGGRLVPTRIMISDLYALDLHSFVWERVWPLQEPASVRDKGKAKAGGPDTSYIDDSPLSQRLASPPPTFQQTFSPVMPSPHQSVGSLGTAPDTPLSPGTLDAILAEDNPFEAAQRSAGPQARYFHSAEAWGDHHIVFFGGMGYTPSSPSSSRDSSPLHPFRMTASDSPMSPAGLQKPSRGDPVLQVLDDVFLFDVKKREWVFERPRCAKGVERPTARYAHLSSLMEQAPVRRPRRRKGSKVAVGLDVELEHDAGEVLAYGETLRSPSRRALAREGGRDVRETGRALLVLMGGQDMSNQYIRELDVLDLDSMTWTERKKFQGNYGTYRSVACAPRWTVRHQDPWAASQVEEAEEDEEEELRRFSWSELPTVDRPEPIYVYSNFNFNESVPSSLPQFRS